MNQHEALAQAAKRIDVYRQGNDWIVSGPYLDVRTEVPRQTYTQALNLAKKWKVEHAACLLEVDIGDNDAWLYDRSHGPISSRDLLSALIKRCK